MDNKERNIETTNVTLEDENLDMVSGGHWDEDAPISERVWEQMTPYEKYTYKTLTQRSDDMKDAGDLAAVRHY